MKDSYVDSVSEVSRCLNAVALQNAVLCAECDVVSNSPHDRCMVCGSRSLINISRMLGGTLPSDRATLIRPVTLETEKPEIDLTFPRAHRVRRKLSA